MLVNVHEAAEFLIPALIVSSVFIVGKVVADSIGTFLTGYDGRTSISVGTGMPQVGEFSLAMVKVGADQGAVGSTLFPIVTVTTAITSFVFPYVFRSANLVTNSLERVTPRVVQTFLDQISLWLKALSSSFRLRSEAAHRIQRAFRVSLINVGVIAILIAVGTFLLGFVDEMADTTGVDVSTLGLVVGSGVIVFCIPPAIVAWRAISDLAEVVTNQMLSRRNVPLSESYIANVRAFVRDGLLASLSILLAIWMIPFVSELLTLGEISVPIPVLLIAAVVFITARSVFAAQEALQRSFAQTFLGVTGRPLSEAVEAELAVGDGSSLSEPAPPIASAAQATPPAQSPIAATSKVPVEEPEPIIRRRRLRRPWVLAAALSIVVAGTFAGIGIVTGGDSTPESIMSVPTAGPGETPDAVSADIPLGIPGPDVPISLPESNAGVLSITFQDLPFSEREGQVLVASHELDSRETRPPGFQVERYLYIDRTATDSTSSSTGLIEFWVPARWMLVNGVLPGDVRLLALADGGWAPLVTEPLEVTESRLLFRADGPTTGVFAVAAGVVN